MKVKKLIEKLSKLPPNADVFYLWDGSCRSTASYVWLSKTGYVVIGSIHNDPVYYNEYMPKGLEKNNKKTYSAATCSYVFNKVNK